MDIDWSALVASAAMVVGLIVFFVAVAYALSTGSPVVWGVICLGFFLFVWRIAYVSIRD